jgi:hypothetical protein
LASRRSLWGEDKRYSGLAPIRPIHSISAWHIREFGDWGAVMTEIPRRQVAMFSVLILLAFSGCSFLGTSPIQSTQVQISDGNPAFTFNYSVSDYATALFEGPSGDVVREERLEPDSSQATLEFRAMPPGEYTLAIQQGGDTVAEKNMEFDGPEPELTNLTVVWSGSTIQRAEVWVRNGGDLPLQIGEGQISARSHSLSTDLYEWIDVNETEMVELSTSYGDSITILGAGDVRGELDLSTSNGTLSGKFSKTFEGPDLSLDDYRMNWDGGSLESVQMTVRNEGDLLADVTPTLSQGGENLDEASEQRIPVGGTTSYEFTGGFGSLYEADSGGNISFEAVLSHSQDFTSVKLSHYLEPANISLTSISPNWQGADLVEVRANVENKGDITVERMAFLRVNGQQIQSFRVEIPGGESRNLLFEPGFLEGALHSASGGGEQTVNVEVDGSTLSQTKTFEGVGGTISDISTRIYGNYDSDTSDMSSIDFRVQNSGDVRLTYDSYKISIDGTSRTVSLYSANELAPGESTTESEYLTDDITVDNGAHTLEVTLRYNGEPVLSEKTSVSTE